MSTIINAPQGSEAWHEHRASHFNASDAPAMLGVSSYKSRSELLREKVTGLTEEVDEHTQRRFDKGHQYEAMARPWAEEIIGEELYPVVLADEIEGLPLSASVDGLTLLYDVAFEHKTLNDRLAASLDQGEIPEEYHPQMEQILMLSDAERCLFMASAGDRDSMRYAWYEPRPELRKKILAGWAQLREDMQNHQPTGDAPEPTGSAPEDLPALRIDIAGEVRDSNLDTFREHALAVIGSINTELQTDEDFANADKTTKWCKEVEQRLEAAKQHALSQTESIDALFRTIDEIREQARQKRLELDKLVKARKEAIREEIRSGAVESLREHYTSINASLPDGIELSAPADFGQTVGTAMKGKKTVKSLRDAADEALASAKIEANEWADHIRANLKRFDALADGYESLFADKGSLIRKSGDDMEATVKARIAEHEAEQQRREEERRQAEQSATPADEEAGVEAEAAEEQAEAGVPDKTDQAKGEEIAWDVTCHVEVRSASDWSPEKVEREVANALADAGLTGPIEVSVKRRRKEVA